MKIYLDSIGCRLNQAEIEMMAQHFRAGGHDIVPGAAGADLAVVNTCAVTTQAAADSRQRIRQVAHAGAGEIIVTGCWSSLEPSAAAALPGVARVVPNGGKDLLVQERLDLPRDVFDLEPLQRQPLPGMHRRTRAFIKVQDGCDNTCTFCVTTVARGPGRSRSIPVVLADIHSALAGGAQEIVLTGVHLGSWGQDSRLHLRDLLKSILGDTATPRLRLSSLEPWDLDEDFFSLWSDPRLMPHLHLPLQSGSASVLRRMLRKTSPGSFRGLVGAARQAIPNLALTTDVIAGFPGETQAEFAQTLDFVREMEFAGGHVFSYSPRPGTPAARMQGQLPIEVRKQRSRTLQREFADLSALFRSRSLGRIVPVLWESVVGLDGHGWQMQGHSDGFILVRAYSPEPRWNRVDGVRLTSVTTEGMKGEITHPSDTMDLQASLVEMKP